MYVCWACMYKFGMHMYNCMSMHSPIVYVTMYICTHILIQNILEPYPPLESSRRFGSTHSLHMPGMCKSESMRSLQQASRRKRKYSRHSLVSF